MTTPLNASPLTTPLQMSTSQTKLSPNAFPSLTSPRAPNTRWGAMALSLISLMALSVMLSGCVVKEELDNTYNQAHLGLNQWDLKTTERGSHTLNFNVGYLIGLVDDEGVKGINWRYELMTRDLEVLGSFSEEMREATPDKEQIFVEGRRTRALEPTSLLSEGETYILWFTLYYNDEILHEQLFPVVAGEEGGDPYWIEELIGERLSDEDLAELGLLDSNAENSETESTETEDSSDQASAESDAELQGVEEASGESPAMGMAPEAP